MLGEAMIILYIVDSHARSAMIILHSVDSNVRRGHDNIVQCGLPC